MKQTPLRVVVAVALAGSLTASGITRAQTQTYPLKPVRVVIPWPAGGSNDIVGRMVMNELGRSLGQQFVIDNRAGASGVIGADIVAKAPPDGYTLMVHSTTHVGNAHLYANKLSYDTLKDFTGVGMLSTQPGVLTVHPSLPVRNLKEFIALAKARPGQINYSSSGNGSAPHLQMALLISMTGIEITHVPYKGGAPQVAALMAGETQASFATVGTVINQIRDKRLRSIALGSTAPSKTLPGVPTIAASGVAGYDMNPWIGVFAPAGTPRPIIDRLNSEINLALMNPEVVARLEQQALDPYPTSVDEFNKVLLADHQKYGKLIKMTGARIE
ncbi:MAG: tripartite tricarboxylate transporter substrate binding protein [Proteobacteria bacterium]|nr:tripartite tricarboxylate transporter substrate binding protein [Burkholderiales bacterium]